MPNKRGNRPIEKIDYKKILILLKHKIDLMEGKEIAPSNLILTIQETYSTLDNTFHLALCIPWTKETYNTIVQILLLI